ncbi:hypothetical protein G7Y89_g7192 [Cudoniella acicularis]|uniref:Mandelate racemase/muconate lactonizing enzyme C-terminal domain-containing protein n=1 Tax=Cudoniella acicularis TaxID=354080 RepID=A0A8H4W2B4_9HELO|nr:hypothetical protein G7Y89_g7192 [Cudoniella acicularis]
MAKISKIEYFRVPPRWLFVKITDAEGKVGWGEASLEGHTQAVEGCLDAYVERDIEHIWQMSWRAGFYRGGPVFMSALAGIDIALWDLKARRLGVPIYQLLGGKLRDKIKVYAWIGGDRPSDVEVQAKARKEQGFTAVKMNATEDLGWLDSPSALDSCVERLKAVKALGMDAGIDFHGRVHKPMAKQLAAALAPHHPLFIEEPLLSENITSINLLSQQTSIPIALGERLYSRWDFRPYLEAGSVDIIQPDVCHCGGISELRRIANMAETYDLISTSLMINLSNIKWPSSFGEFHYLPGNLYQREAQQAFCSKQQILINDGRGRTTRENVVDPSLFSDSLSNSSSANGLSANFTSPNTYSSSAPGPTSGNNTSQNQRFGSNLSSGVISSIVISSIVISSIVISNIVISILVVFALEFGCIILWRRKRINIVFHKLPNSDTRELKPELGDLPIVEIRAVHSTLGLRTNTNTIEMPVDSPFPEMDAVRDYFFGYAK